MSTLINKIRRLNPIVKAGLIILVIASLLVASVTAASFLWVPSDNNLEGTPLDPAATPTPTPTPTSTPEPEPENNIVGAVLTGNDTDAEGNYIFFRGDTLHITVTCNGTGIRDVQLYNKAALIDTKQTSAAGTVHFYRIVNNAYNYTVKVYNEIP